MDHNTQLILTELEYLEKKKQVLERLLQNASGTVASHNTTQQLLTGGNALVGVSESSDSVDTYRPRHTHVMKRLIC